MNNSERTTWSGMELFQYYTQNLTEYANHLQMARFKVGDEIFNLLEKAERLGKRVVLTLVDFDEDNEEYVATYDVSIA